MITICDAVNDNLVFYKGYHLLNALSKYMSCVKQDISVEIKFETKKVEERWVNLVKNL